MRRPDFDFSGRPGLLSRLGYLLLLLAVLAAAWVGHLYMSASQQLETSEAKWRSLQKARRSDASNPRQRADWEQLQAELKAANRVIGRLSMPWDALFQQVEATVDEQITLLAVEPDTEKREVRITAEAKSFNAMLDYFKRVRAVPLFREAHVINHQIQQQDPQRPVRFIVTAQWLEIGSPAAAAETVSVVGTTTAGSTTSGITTSGTTTAGIMTAGSTTAGPFTAGSTTARSTAGGATTGGTTTAGIAAPGAAVPATAAVVPIPAKPTITPPFPAPAASASAQAARPPAR
jgi:hypothetical protein